MAELGKMNRLQVVKTVAFGVYVDGGQFNQVLVPKRYVPRGCAIGDWLDLFLYLDSENIPVGTTETPLVMADECAYLKVVDVNKVGAFLDWGLPKDLLVPYREQQTPMVLGQSYVVYVTLDPSGERIMASSHLNRYLYETSTAFESGEAVNILVCDQSAIGYKVVIEDTHLGLIFNADVLLPLAIGQRLTGYIKDLRPDDKLTLSVQAPSVENRGELTQRILDFLQAEGGSTTLTDKSPPDAVYQQFGVSKANYKKALGALYKQQRIVLGKDKITLA